MTSPAVSSAIRMCGLVPTYDNPATIERVVSTLLGHVPHVVVVDDGSGPDARPALSRLAADARVTLVHREVNGGKGAAVKTGLAWALEEGYTHALQVDADGQHDLDDAPKLLEAARQDPRALVLARPVFDSSAPRARLWGRRITNFWVTLETMSRKIGDPMCGFRIYPVAETVAAGAVGNRMDFDPEVAVRLVWMGLPVVNVPTRVRYVPTDEGGVSHFRLVRDNVAIGAIHTRLCITGIFRFLFGWAVRRRARA